MISLLLTALSLAMSSDSERLTSSPSYTIFNRWYESTGRIKNISEAELTEKAIYQAEIKEKPAKNAMLVINTNALGVTAYTSGKTLYSSEPSLGAKIHFIPIDEITEGGTITLHLTPHSKVTGRVIADVKLSTVNDYLFVLLSRNVKTIVAGAVLLFITLIITTFAFYKLSKGNRSGFGDFYLAAFTGIWFFCLLFKSDLAAFFIGSSEMIYAVKYTALSLLSVPLACFMISKCKLKSKTLEIIQAVIVGYAVFRLGAFLLLDAPLERGKWIIYALMFTNISATVIKTVSQGVPCVKNVSLKIASFSP